MVGFGTELRKAVIKRLPVEGRWKKKNTAECLISEFSVLEELPF